MTSTFDNFKTFAIGVLSWTATVAMIVGGIWTLYRFTTLDREHRVQQTTFQKDHIDIHVHAHHEILENNRHTIAANVEITNTGSRDTLLDYGYKPFSVAKLHYDSQGNSRLGEELTQAALISQSRLLRSGESINRPFFVAVEDPGMYLILFRARISDVPNQPRTGVGPDEDATWVGSTFLNIRSSK